MKTSLGVGVPFPCGLLGNLSFTVKPPHNLTKKNQNVANVVSILGMLGR
jgi:hypothetical protein